MSVPEMGDPLSTCMVENSWKIPENLYGLFIVKTPMT